MNCEVCGPCGLACGQWLCIEIYMWSSPSYTELMVPIHQLWGIDVFLHDLQGG